MTRTSVNLTWKEPVNDGGLRSIRYTVECYHCVNGSKCYTMVKNAMFFPAKTNINTTSVVVLNLVFKQKYKFKVTSINSLKNVPSGKWKFIEKIAVIGKATQTTNSETKCKCEVKASNSIVMFFVGPGVTLAIVLFIVIFFLVCKRYMKTPKESTNVHVMETVETQDQSSAESGATQSQNAQSYVSSIDDAATLDEEVPTSAVYTKLYRNRQDKKAADNTYQKLLKHDSGYAFQCLAK